MQAGLSLCCLQATARVSHVEAHMMLRLLLPCFRLEPYAPDSCADFYDSLRAGLFWISTQISFAGPIESLHETVLLLMIKLATLSA